MNPSSANPELTNQPLDRLLREFYRQEMPNPWPAFQAHERLHLCRRKPFGFRSPALASRLALAAVLALLLLCGWLMPDRSAGPEIGPLLLGPGEASRPRLEELAPLRQPELPDPARINPPLPK